MEVKELTNYDLKRVISRAEKEFGKIVKGTEDDYYPQLGYIEHHIYELHNIIDISDYDLQSAISIIIYDLKGIIEDKHYDYLSIIDDETLRFALSLETLFNPFLNNEIKINKLGKEDLKGLFTLPIICLTRIYDSIDFWRMRYGKDGYFKMLEEFVAHVMEIGPYPYALDEKYLDD